MALSDDLRKRVVEAVVLGGLSRNAAARRFGVSIASAVRWVTRYKTTGQISPSRSGGDRRSGRIEAQRAYLLGLIRRTPDITLLEIQERSSGARTFWSGAGTGSPPSSILIPRNSSSSTRPALPPVSLERMDAAGADGDCGPPSRTPITRRSRSLPVCAFEGLRRRGSTTGR